MKVVPFLIIAITLHFSALLQTQTGLKTSTTKIPHRQFDTETTSDSMSINVAKTEAIANGIQLNGKSNSVTIIQSSEISDSTESNSISGNKVKINGENNAVTIRQSGKSCNTTIHQKGNSNQVHIIQKPK